MQMLVRHSRHCDIVTVPHPDHGPAGRPMDVGEADRLATVMAAFSTGSRVLILFALFDQERTVDDLASAVNLDPRLVSQQLRVLRLFHLVMGRKDGRHVRYRLADDHVRELLVAVRAHGEHLTPDIAEREPPE